MLLQRKPLDGLVYLTIFMSISDGLLEYLTSHFMEYNYMYYEFRFQCISILNFFLNFFNETSCLNYL